MALSTALAGDDFFSAFPFSLPGFGALTRFHGGDRDVARGIPIDVRETDKEYTIEADIPGVNRGDIRVSVDGDVVTIAVDSQDVKEEEGTLYHRVERTSRFVRRRIRLPDSADTSRVEAKHDNGVLRVVVPKNPERVRQQQIDVT